MVHHHSSLSPIEIRILGYSSLWDAPASWGPVLSVDWPARKDKAESQRSTGKQKELRGHVWQKKCALDLLGGHVVQTSHQWLPLPVLNLVPATQLSEPSVRFQTDFAFTARFYNADCQIRTSAKDHRAPRFCFHFPNAWAKNGGTCKPTADISSQRHVAHFRDFGFHSRIICDYLKVSDGGFSQEVISKLPTAWFMEEPRMDRGMKSGDMGKRASLSFIWLTCMLFEFFLAGQ